MKRVVIVRDNPISPDSRVEKTADTLITAGHKVCLLAWDRDENYNKKISRMSLVANKVDIVRFGIKASFGDGVKNLLPFCIFQIRIFFWLIKNKSNYDIIHACDFYTAATSFICAKLMGRKIVFDIFDFIGDIKDKGLSGFIAKLQYKIINHSNATIICTEHRKEQIDGSNPSKLVIIHNSPMNVDVSEIFHLNKDKIKIVYVGILQEKRFLKEMADIIIRLYNVELHIGGFGKYEDYFRRLARDNKNIYFYGKLQYISTLSLEKSCDIMTAIYDPEVRNHYFAAPNKFYEALMLGKPLIMIKNTGMSNIVSDNRIGELSDYNPESLKIAIEKLISRRNEWDEISGKMQELYRREFSWNKMGKKLIKLYDTI